MRRCCSSRRGSGWRRRELNKLLRAAIEANPPPIYQNRRPKIYFATQVGVQPPTIVLFCNDPAAISQTYRRYLLGVFRDRLPFAEVPIKLYLRRREERDKPPPGVEEIMPMVDEPAPSTRNCRQTWTNRPIAKLRRSSNRRSDFRAMLESQSLCSQRFASSNWSGVNVDSLL